MSPLARLLALLLVALALAACGKKGNLTLPDPGLPPTPTQPASAQPPAR
jgi:predicted small lipoprotein YifL